MGARNCHGMFLSTSLKSTSKGMCWFTPKLGCGRSWNDSIFQLGLASQSLVSPDDRDEDEGELEASSTTAWCDLTSSCAVVVAESAAASLWVASRASLAVLF